MATCSAECCLEIWRRLHATGRRYCSGMMVTMDLRPRQDLFMGYLVNSAIGYQDDILDLTVGPACPSHLSFNFARSAHGAFPSRHADT
jgi:hypothetical protein